MSPFKIMGSDTTHLIESLGNTSQMKNIMNALISIDSKNGKDVGKDGWEKVKDAFENFGFTICYDRNLALLTIALFDAIARSKCSSLVSDAKFVINIKAKNKKNEIVSLGQAFLKGDGYSIYAILNCPTFKKILRNIGVSEECIKKYIDRLKKITTWRLSSSKNVLNAIAKAFDKMTGEHIELDEAHAPQISDLYIVNDGKDFGNLEKIKGKIKYVEISKGVDVPSGGAFKNFKNLKEVGLPSDLKSIAGGTFYGCSALEKIVIPNTVTSIGYGSFNGCESLEEIVIPESVTGFDSAGYAFANCKKLKKVIMKCKIQYIEQSMFENCTELTDIEIPEGVTNIQRKAFEGCSKLSKVTIPNSVTKICEEAFKDCPQNMQILGNPRPEIIDEIEEQIGRV